MFSAIMISLHVHTLELCENPITPNFVAVYTDCLGPIGKIPEVKANWLIYNIHFANVPFHNNALHKNT